MREPQHSRDLREGDEDSRLVALRAVNDANNRTVFPLAMTDDEKLGA